MKITFTGEEWMAVLRRSTRFFLHSGIALSAIVSVFALVVIVGFVNRLIQPLATYGDILFVTPLFVFIYALIRHRAQRSPRLLTYAITFLSTAVLVPLFMASVALVIGTATGLG